jgi:hypothetical protein
MRCIRLGVLATVLLASSYSHAQGFLPSLPTLHSLSVGGEADTSLGTTSNWKNPGTTTGANIEVGLLVYPHVKMDTSSDDSQGKKPAPGTQTTLPSPPYTAATLYVGTAFFSSSADITDTLHTVTGLRDSYVGARAVFRVTRCIDVFAGGDVRFVSFDSGRVYQDNPTRTAFTISGDGLGAEANVGVAWGIVYVQVQAIERYIPSVVVVPPMGTTLPSNVPESVSLRTIGVSAGIQLSFDRDSKGQSAPIRVEN